jgi:hypothetical protein
MSKIYHAKVASNLETGEHLSTWLEKYIDAVVPNNGIEYWTEFSKLRPNVRFPIWNAAQQVDFKHFAVYQQIGSSEGILIDVVVKFTDLSAKPIARLKTFANEKIAAQIIAALNHAISDIGFYRVQPIMDEIDALIPRERSFDQNTNYQGVFVLSVTNSKLVVSLGSQQVLADYDFSSSVDSACFVNQYLTDWLLMLKRRNCRFKLEGATDQNSDNTDWVEKYVRLCLLNELDAINHPVNTERVNTISEIERMLTLDQLEMAGAKFKVALSEMKRLTSIIAV